MGEAGQVFDLILSQAEIMGQVLLSEGVVWWVSASGEFAFLSMKPQRRTVVGWGTKFPTFFLGKPK